MKRTAKMIAAGFSTVALAVAIGAGLAYAGPEQTPAASPSTTPNASPTEKPDRKHEADQTRPRPGLLRRALHGEATLGGEKHRVVVFQRGIVETVTATALTVKSQDGFTASYVLNGETRVRKEKQEASRSDITVKDRVRVLATKDGSTLIAKAVRDHGA